MMNIERTIGVAKNDIIHRGYDINDMCRCHGHGATKFMLKYLNVPGRSRLTTKKQMWEAIYPILKSEVASDNLTYVNLSSYWRRNR